MSGQSPNSLTVSEKLAARLERPVAVEARGRAASHVLDWAACAVAGANSEAAKAMGRVALKDSPLDQILYTGALGNVLEMDDVDKRALLHPGPVVIPAAIAAAETVGANAGDFLDGVARGYEAMIRIGRAVGPAHYQYWHNTGTVGPFGAAAAAGSIFNLDTENIVYALGLAGTQSSGLWQVRHEPGSYAKQLHTARAAHAGFLAAQLAQSGFVGLRAVLEGPQGFFAATCGDADPHKITDFLDDAPWAIHDVSFKPWPACRHAHAVIDSALALKEKGLEAEAIESLSIRSYRDAIIFCNNPAPADTLSAKFSLQHAAAVTLLKGAPGLEDFEQAARELSEISALRGRISVIEDARFTDQYPARFGAAINATLKDGTEYEVVVEDALGDPENPISQDQLAEKAKTLMAAGGLNERQAEKLIQSVLALSEDDKAFDEFAMLLKKAIRI